VKTFFDTYGPEISDSGPPGFACIGQYTAEQLAEYGAVPSVMADIHSAEGLAASVKQYFDKKGEK
jgi:uroporphyrinogen-III synthase